MVLAGIVALTLPLVAQQAPPAGGRGQRQPGREDQGPLGTVGALGQEVRRAPTPTGPAPRLPDGTVDLNGLWAGGGPTNSLAQGLPKGETLPLLPKSKEIMADRATRETDDPHLWCMPMGVSRSTPYPFRFVQNYTHKAPTHIFILHEGNIQVTIEDPGAFSRPFTTTWTARLAAPGDEIMEYICQENNQYGIAGGHKNPFAN